MLRLKNLWLIAALGLFLLNSCKDDNKVEPVEKDATTELVEELDKLIATAPDGAKYQYSLDEDGYPYRKGQYVVTFPNNYSENQRTLYFATLKKIVEEESKGEATIAIPKSGLIHSIYEINTLAPYDPCSDIGNGHQTQGTVARLQGDFPMVRVSPNYFVQSKEVIFNPTSFAELTSAPETAVDAGDVVIGLIDSGIDYNDACFNGYIWRNPETRSKDYIGGAWINTPGPCPGKYVTSFSNNPMDENHRHGTKVAKVILKSTENLTSAAAVVGKSTPKIRIMPLKVFDANGISDLAKIEMAIEYGRGYGVKIFNCSFILEVGGQANSAAAAIANIFNDPSLSFIAAAGNSGVNISSNHLVYPAILSGVQNNVITVGALRTNNTFSGQSNFSSTLVNVSALGEYTSLCGGTILGAGYTSYATPVVSVGYAYLSWLDTFASPGDLRADLYSTIQLHSSPLQSLQGKVEGQRTFSPEMFFAPLVQ